MPEMIVDTGTEAWLKAGDCDSLLLLFLRQGLDGPHSGNMSKCARSSRCGLSNEDPFPSSSAVCFVVVYCAPQHLLCFERIIGSKFKTGGRHAPRYVVEFVLKDWLYRVQFMCSLAVGLQIGWGMSQRKEVWKRSFLCFFFLLLLLFCLLLFVCLFYADWLSSKYFAF